MSRRMSRKPPTARTSSGALSPAPGETPSLLYSAQDESLKVRVLVQAETLWLTLAHMAELFGVGVPAISKHLKNIFESGELSREPSVCKMQTVQSEGGRQVRRTLDYYNLDAIIAVGYRVNSRSATQSRIWATGVLKEYIRKGFVLDDERLKQGKRVFGEDYFRELCERARSIQASERCIWQQITDIFAECSIDYDPKSELTQDFFATVQNKFHHAITGQTAAEIIHAKADRTATRKGNNVYKIDGKDIIIQTRYCYVYAYSEEAIFKASGYGGELIFLDSKDKCDVKAVFGLSKQKPGKYVVTVSREDDDWYEVLGTDSYIKTSTCLSLALGEEAYLTVSASGFGQLRFEDGDDSMVEGVYMKLPL